MASTKKSSKRGRVPTSAKANLAASNDWVEESRAALIDLAHFIRQKARAGELTTLEAIGAYRALGDAMNDRDSIMGDDEESA